ncbi:MAG TPA: tripartite tricarboxylate transporter substrate binding protein [Burkholderiales bacterium]|nr:tripartite tricarboxylate transporter substrate binding protein [Burkholderiales bacterium]
MKRRMFTAIASVAALLPAVACGIARAADWPERPIRWIVPFGAGGANDLIARAAADAVGKRLGQPVIIENKPGAGAILGADYVARAKPDGYTWLVGAAGVVTNSMIQAKMPYQDSDLVPVGMIAVAPSVIVVNPNVPASNLKEFIAWAKTQSKGIDWSTAGSGSTPHFVAEMLREDGVNVNIIPFKSGSEGVTAVLTGTVPVTSEASIVVLPSVKAGKLKALATTYKRRITAYDQLPTAKEQGFANVEIGHWAGLFAPKGVPQPILDKMAKELEAAVRSPAFRDKVLPTGIEPEPGTTADFVAFITAERERLGRLAKKANMRADQ